jgi:histone H3/H4
MKGDLIVRSNIRKNSEFSVSDEFLNEFEKQIEELLKKAENRAKENFRRTLLARDL